MYKCYYKDATISFTGGWLDAPHLKDSSKILHREDGPAIEEANGSKHWYINGQRHREDGPAVEYSDGTKQWFLNSKRHREDGPAIEWADKDEMWWLDHEQYSKKEFNNILKEIDSLDPVIGLLDPREWVRNRWKRRLSNAS